MNNELKEFFDYLLEDVEASDFSKFVPEKAASEAKKKDDAEDSCC